MAALLKQGNWQQEIQSAAAEHLEIRMPNQITEAAFFDLITAIQKNGHCERVTFKEGVFCKNHQRDDFNVLQLLINGYLYLEDDQFKVASHLQQLEFVNSRYQAINRASFLEKLDQKNSPIRSVIFRNTNASMDELTISLRNSQGCMIYFVFGNPVNEIAWKQMCDDLKNNPALMLSEIKTSGIKDNFQEKINEIEGLIKKNNEEAAWQEIYKSIREEINYDEEVSSEETSDEETYEYSNDSILVTHLSITLKENNIYIKPLSTKVSYDCHHEFSKDDPNVFSWKEGVWLEKIRNAPGESIAVHISAETNRNGYYHEERFMPFDDYMVSLMRVLKLKKEIQRIALSNLYLSPEAIHSICEALPYLPHLRILDVKSCYAANIEELFDNLNRTAIQEIRLVGEWDRMKINCVNLERELAHENCPLVKLELRGTQSCIDSASLTHIFRGLKTNSHITQFIFAPCTENGMWKKIQDACIFSTETAQALAECLQNNKTLKYLWLGMAINESIMRTLKNGLKNNTTLKDLSLVTNYNGYFTPEAVDEMCALIENNSSLTHLSGLNVLQWKFREEKTEDYSLDDPNGMYEMQQRDVATISILGALRKNDSLKNIGHLEMGVTALEKYIDVVTNHPSLSELGFKCEKVPDSQKKISSLMIGFLNKLQNNNKIKKINHLSLETEEFSALIDLLDKNTTLEELRVYELNGCCFQPEKELMLKFLRVLTKNAALKKLNIMVSLNTRADIQALTMLIQSNKIIKKLYLYDIDITESEGSLLCGLLTAIVDNYNIIKLSFRSDWRYFPKQPERRDKYKKIIEWLLNFVSKRNKKFGQYQEKVGVFLRKKDEMSAPEKEQQKYLIELQNEADELLELASTPLPLDTFITTLLDKETLSEFNIGFSKAAKNFCSRIYWSLAEIAEKVGDHSQNFVMLLRSTEPMALIKLFSLFNEYFLNNSANNETITLGNCKNFLLLFLPRLGAALQDQDIAKYILLTFTSLQERSTKKSLTFFPTNSCNIGVIFGNKIVADIRKEILKALGLNPENEKQIAEKQIEIEGELAEKIRQHEARLENEFFQESSEPLTKKRKLNTGSPGWQGKEEEKVAEPTYNLFNSN